MRQVIWHQKAKTDIRAFPEDVKDKLGYLLYRVQLGEDLTMPHVRSMRSVAKGVKEFRVKGADSIYRSFYLVIDDKRVTVFHAFNKKTQKTPQHEINLGKKHLKEVIQCLDQK